MAHRKKRDDELTRSYREGEPTRKRAKKRERRNAAVKEVLVPFLAAGIPLVLIWIIMAEVVRIFPPWRALRAVQVIGYSAANLHLASAEDLLLSFVYWNALLIVFALPAFIAFNLLETRKEIRRRSHLLILSPFFTLPPRFLAAAPVFALTGGRIMPLLLLLAAAVLLIFRVLTYFALPAIFLSTALFYILLLLFSFNTITFFYQIQRIVYGFNRRFENGGPRLLCDGFRIVPLRQGGAAILGLLYLLAASWLLLHRPVVDRDAFNANPAAVNGPVRTLAFSPDGTLLASGAGDTAIRLWNGQNGKFIRLLAGHRTDVLTVAFSSDGKYIASGGEDRMTRLQRVDRRGRIFYFGGHRGAVRAATFSPDGGYLATAGGAGRIIVRRTDNTLTLLSPRNRITGLRSLTYSPDGRYLAGAGDRRIAIWEIDTPNRHSILEGNSNSRWILKGSRLKALEGYRSDILSLAFHPRGELLASADSEGRIQIREWRNGKIRNEFRVSNSAIRSIVYSPDGRAIAAGGQDAKVRLIDSRDGRVLLVDENYGKDVRAVAFHPGGNYFVSGGDDGLIRLHVRPEN